MWEKTWYTIGVDTSRAIPSAAQPAPSSVSASSSAHLHKGNCPPGSAGGSPVRHGPGGDQVPPKAVPPDSASLLLLQHSGGHGMLSR